MVSVVASVCLLVVVVVSKLMRWTHLKTWQNSVIIWLICPWSHAMAKWFSTRSCWNASTQYSPLPAPSPIKTRVSIVLCMFYVLMHFSSPCFCIWCCSLLFYCFVSS